MENKETETTKKSWGGARKGAGRKCKGNAPLVTIAFRVPSEIKEQLKRLSKAEGKSIGEYITKLLEMQ
jgi:hypothetical protein